MRRTAWLLAAALAAAACSGSSGPSAPPALVKVVWIAGGQSTQVWAGAEPDAGLAALAPPAVKQIDFVFDQRLDGTKIENDAEPPLAVSWVDAAGAPAGLDAQVLYNSEPLYGGTTSYAFLRPAIPGVPISQTVTLSLARAAITGTSGQPFVGPDQVNVTTGPLTAAVQLPSHADAGASVPTSFMVPIVFSNRVSADGLAPFIHASTPAGAVPISLAANASDPTIVYVTAACPGGWPTAAPVTVTVEAGAPDAFGGLLATPASGTFTAVGAGAAPDGGC
jgi:hypothetical protein